MKLSKLASKPQLIELVLNDEEIIEEFGEALEFYTWDRQPLDVFMRLANAKQDDMGQMLDIVRTLILDDAGKPVIEKDAMLPTNVLLKAINAIVEQLGK